MVTKPAKQKPHTKQAHALFQRQPLLHLHETIQAVTPPPLL